VKKIIFGLALVAGVAGGVYWAHRPEASSKINTEEFVAEPLEWGSLLELVNATGGLQPLPDEIVVVGSELSGKVVYVHGDFNDKVEKDQLLLRLDKRRAELQLEQAKLALDKAQQQEINATALSAKAKLAYEKAVSVQEKKIGGVTQLDVDLAAKDHEAAQGVVKAARIQVREAENAVKQAQLGLDLTEIRAPCAGTIVDRKVTLNQMIAPPVSANLFTLAKNLQNMQILAQVPEGDIGKIQVGQDVTFQVYGYSNEKKPFTGKVQEIHPLPINVQGAVFYTTVIKADNAKDPDTKEWQLRPGMTPSVDIIWKDHREVWMVPASAVSLELDEAFQSPEVKSRLQHWKDVLKEMKKAREDVDAWKTVWILDAERQPWPIFLKTGVTGRKKGGDPDSQFVEVIAWEKDPRLDPFLDPQKPANYPRVITGVPEPPASKGLWSIPRVRL
jgi:HlyD family secretion protein